MSLINEALKKAQKQRLAEQEPLTPAVPGAPTAPRVAKRAQPMAAKSTVMLALGGAVVLTIAGAITLWIFLWEPEPVPPLPRRAVAPKAKPASTEAGPTVTFPSVLPATGGNAAGGDTPPQAAPGDPAAPKATGPTPAGAALHSPAGTWSPSATPGVLTAPEQPGPSLAAGAPGASKPLPPAGGIAPAPPAGAAPKAAPPNPQVYVFLDTLRVTGVRVSPTDPKALMNERVFRIGDLVDRGLGLRLSKVEAGSLTFTDPAGNSYVKSF